MRKGWIVMFAKGYLPDDGGIERYSTCMAHAFTQDGSKVLVLTQCAGKIGLWRDVNRRVLVLNVGKSAQYKVFLRIALAWLAIRKRIDTKFILATTWRMALPLLATFDNTPVAVSLHGREILIVPRLLRPLLKWVLNHSRLRASVSKITENLARDIAPLAGGKWMVTWNGLSFIPSVRPDERYTKPPGEPLIIYSFCRLVERKNVESSIHAFEKLVRSGQDNVRLVIAGGGELLKPIRQISATSTVSDKIQVLGRIEDNEIAGYYEQADIFIHPQIAADGGRDIEGFGLTIADAMSFGVPVIVGSAGGPSEFVADGQTGRVVDGTDLDSIYDALSKLTSDTAYRQKLGQAGQAYAMSTFSWVKAAELIRNEFK